MATQAQLESDLTWATQKYGSDSRAAKMLREQLRVLAEAPASAYETFMSGARPSGKHSGTDTKDTK